MYKFNWNTCMKKKNDFNIIHSDLPDLFVTKVANKYKLEKFLHLSALGIEKCNR